MNWTALLLAGALGAGLTGSAFMASRNGWGLSGRLEKPVSIRKGSTGHHYVYFTGTRRRHWRGGYHFGK